MHSQSSKLDTLLRRSVKITTSLKATVIPPVMKKDEDILILMGKGQSANLRLMDAACSKNRRLR